MLLPSAALGPKVPTDSDTQEDSEPPPAFSTSSISVRAGYLAPADPDLHRFDLEIQGLRLQVKRVDRKAELEREARNSVDAPPSARPRTRRGVIGGWSPSSRTNFLRRIASLDLVGHFGLLTLTLPGNWTDLPTPMTPDRFKAVRIALIKRLARHYGCTVANLWKLEFQHRGAPHFHLGVRLDDFDDQVLSFVRTAWHDLVVHDGAPCPHPTADSCRHHLRYGADLDTQYGDRLKSAGTAFASYFAKHGVWADKEYQHRLPTAALREAGHVELANAWARPGRWWGDGGIPLAKLVEGEMSLEEVEAARLLARKVMVRRTWRYVERSQGEKPVLIRRYPPSLCSEGGFWLLMAQPLEFVSWFLDAVRQVAQVPPGIERARFVATLQEPDSRPSPSTRERSCATR